MRPFLLLIAWLVLPANAGAEIVAEHDVAANGRGEVAVAWIAADGRYTTLKVAQAAATGPIGPVREITRAARTGGGGEDHELRSPQIELFDDGSVLLVWRRIRYVPDIYANASETDLFASVDFGPAQPLDTDSPTALPPSIGSDPSGWAAVAWDAASGLAIARRAPREAQLRVDVARGVGTSPSAGVSATGEVTVVTTRDPGRDCRVIATQAGPGGFQPARLVATAGSCLPQALVTVGGNGDVAALWNADHELRGALGTFGGFGAPVTIRPRTPSTALGAMTAEGELLALTSPGSGGPALRVARAPGEPGFRVEPTTLPAGAVPEVARDGTALAVAGADAYLRPPGGEFGPPRRLTDRPIRQVAADADGAVSFVDETDAELRLLLARPHDVVVLARHEKPPAPPPPPPRPQAIIANDHAPVRLARGRIPVRILCQPTGLRCAVKLTVRAQLPRARRGRLVGRWRGTLASGRLRTVRLRPRVRARMVFVELETRRGSVDRRSIVLRRRGR